MHLVDSTLAVDLLGVALVQPVIGVVEVRLGNTLNVVEHVLLLARVERVEGGLNISKCKHLVSLFRLGYSLTQTSDISRGFM